MLPKQFLREAFMAAVLRNDETMVRQQLQLRGRFTVEDAWLAEGVIVAAENDYREVLRLLIGKGADVNAQYRQGVTALMLAAGRGNSESLHLLVDNGADANATDHNGLKAQDYALIGRQKELAVFLKELEVVQYRQAVFKASHEASCRSQLMMGGPRNIEIRRRVQP